MLPFTKRKYPKSQQRTTLLSELEAKINSGKGIRYDQAMKVIKLKQMAKTFVFLEEHGYGSIYELAKAASDAESRFNELKERIKAAENRIVEIQTLKTHIINYARTNEIWIGYRKSGYSKKYLAEHEGDIILHRTAKKAFDDSGLKKIPTVRKLNEEFSKLLADKKEAYAEYNKVKEESRELMIHKANVEYILGLDGQKNQVKGIHYE